MPLECASIDMQIVFAKQFWPGFLIYLTHQERVDPFQMFTVLGKEKTIVLLIKTNWEEYSFTFQLHFPN